jgi:hypothetical protein
MRLAQAMIVGHEVKHLVPWRRDDGQGGGCALGLAEAGYETSNLEAVFPFLRNNATAPCGCQDFKQKNFHNDALYSSGIHTVCDVVAHISNEHICGDGSWTLERLAEWLDKIELKESSI